MNKFWLHLKNKSTLILIVIFILAIGLRVYKLNQIPYGFYWDEAAITYNAWGLSVWNRDEFGNKLPISFKSFGDYKAPFLIYVLGAIYKVTGLHPEYLRILISFAGIGSVILMYFLTKEYEKQKILPPNSALVTTFFIAITPWAINFSRFGVEAMLALFLFLGGTLFLEKSKINSKYLFLASVLYALCLYTYHSAKLVVPLYLLIWSLANKQVIQKYKKHVIPAILLGLVLLFPLLKDTFFASGFERGKSLILFDNNLSLLPKNIASFLSLDFWVFGKDSIGLRHGVSGFGVLPKTVLFLLLVGITISLKKRQHRNLIIWLIIGLLPSIISTDAPHAIRSLFALPPVILLATIGYSKLPKYIRAFLIVLIIIETCLYLSSYYGSYAINSAADFQYGYKEAILVAEKNAGKNDKIIVTDFYGQPYIYTLLYRKLTPEEFKFGALANYEFHNISWPNEAENRVYIATPNDIPPSDPAVIKVITIPKTDIPVFVLAKK